MGDGQRRLGSRQITALNNGERVYRRPPLAPERTRIWRVTSYVGVRQEIASSIILIDDNQVLPRGPDGYHHTTHHRSRCSLAGRRLVRSRSLVLSRSSRAGTPYPGLIEFLEAIPLRPIVTGSQPYGSVSSSYCGHAHP